MIASKIYSEISIVCPIDGVSIGNTSDKSTWKINFSQSATAQQRSAAQAAIENFDVSAFNQTQQSRTQRAIGLESEASADQFIDQLRTATPTQIRNFVTNNVTDLASAKVLLGRMAIAIAYLLRDE